MQIIRLETTAPGRFVGPNLQLGAAAVDAPLGYWVPSSRAGGLDHARVVLSGHAKAPVAFTWRLEVLGPDDEVVLDGEGTCAWGQGWPAEKLELTTDHIEAEVQALRLTLDLVDERGRTS